MKMIPHLRPLLLACLAAFSTIQAQQPEAQGQYTEEEKKDLEEIEKVGWQREGAGNLNNIATVNIPKGYRFTTGTGASRVLELSGNLPMPSAAGMLTTEGFGPWIIFRYEDSGHVKDDDKNEFDAEKMLEARKEGLEESNKVRIQKGLNELEILGWAVPPRYNDKIKRVENAIRIKSKNSPSESINYETQLLGRTGYMEVQLVCGPEELDSLLRELESLLTGYSFIEGQRYADFSVEKGDRIAEYGVTALVAGGGAYALAKSGLLGKLGLIFAKMGKAAILLVVGVFVAIKKLFSKLFGFRQSE
ncbi:MAG: hypothetical protein RLZZ476_2108 [Verrucomicrobiota bacterium]|jgi:uncharacterized membrane-anchored protein